ncbi:hypothetical protein B0A48_16236 [Cryoendolithus antarcticus]|uniref:Uncharacterized protein n=1 Tax=Cryoendolithus antarcticus TaxID=1507870 RepID=A0A1V8SFJ8_9PEZI|nr:hypothetical protein B0A48_16236 [Cryoendolithus antarcticus]
MSAHEDPNHTAPYEPWPGTSAAPDHYHLTLQPGYQITVRGWLGIVDTDDPWIEQTENMEHSTRKHACVINQEQRERIRHYPGVASIVQFGDEQWLRDRDVLWFPERKYSSRGYLVNFADPNYTVGEHLAKIGHTFDAGLELNPSKTRYYSPGGIDVVSDAQVRDIFSDPRVLDIWETGSAWH